MKNSRIYKRGRNPQHYSPNREYLSPQPVRAQGQITIESAIKEAKPKEPSAKQSESANPWQPSEVWEYIYRQHATKSENSEENKAGQHATKSETPEENKTGGGYKGFLWVAILFVIITAAIVYHYSLSDGVTKPVPGITANVPMEITNPVYEEAASSPPPEAPPSSEEANARCRALCNEKHEKYDEYTYELKDGKLSCPCKISPMAVANANAKCKHLCSVEHLSYEEGDYGFKSDGKLDCRCK